jgi:hypothetical protein
LKIEEKATQRKHQHQLKNEWIRKKEGFPVKLVIGILLEMAI